ncbi:MAG: alpha/beta hydrolase domain-containing protein, partial [Caulobacterales bacterium]
TPILVLATECEALDNYPVRQPDTDTFRFWEIAGATHADIAQTKDMNAIMARDGVTSPLPPVPYPNVVEYDYVKDAGLRWLVRWAREKTPPPRFPLIDINKTSSGTGKFVRDAEGNATGGLRLPELAAATGVHKGKNKLNPYQALSGESILFSLADMERVHGTRENFLAMWDKTVDALLAAELALPEEAQAIRARGRRAWP